MNIKNNKNLILTILFILVIGFSVGYYVPVLAQQADEKFETNNKYCKQVGHDAQELQDNLDDGQLKETNFYKSL